MIEITSIIKFRNERNDLMPPFLLSCAGSSPISARSSTPYRAGSITNLFFTSLRRTRSHFFTTPSKSRPLSMGDFGGGDQADSTHDADIDSAHDADIDPTYNGGVSSFSSGDVPPDVHNMSAPELLIRAQEERGLSQQPDVDAGQVEEAGQDASMMPEVLIRVRTATMTSTDSSSLRTLTDDNANSADLVKEQRFSPNPAGAASVSGSHVRHTTSSSVESEGFHSVTSEDMAMEDKGLHHWSKAVSQPYIHIFIQLSIVCPTTPITGRGTVGD